MTARNGAVHVATIKKTVGDKVYVTHLLRRSVREGKKVKHGMLGNISHLPPDLIETIRRRLADGPASPQSPSENGVNGRNGFRIVRTLPHGHVAATLGMVRQVGLEQILGSRSCRQRDAVVAMIVARIIDPGSKLGVARHLASDSASSSLGTELDLEAITEDDLYQALDWLVARQRRIENKIAKRHLSDGSLVLYDVSSSYYTGRCCPLARFGYSRDGKSGFPQIIYGLLCNGDGCPVGIEVFEGNTADPTTLSAQIDKVRRRFKLRRVVFVGDRGMITSKRIDEELRPIDGLDWITSLRADAIQKLAAAKRITPSLFDETNLAEIQSPDFPGERLIVCRNPLLADERARKRQELLAATRRDLDLIVAATARTRRPLRGKDEIGMRVGRALDKHKVRKHFAWTIEENSFRYELDQAGIDAEAALDGIYVVRTSVDAATFDATGAVRAYKDLAKVERAFRCLKTVDLHVRPIFHRNANRVRAHVFLCMLAYYVEWHLRRKLAPVLFDDHDRAAAEAARPSIVDPAPRSAAATRKDTSKRTPDNLPVQSFASLLQHLATLAIHRVTLSDSTSEFTIRTEPTPLQRRVFELLNLPL